MRYLLATQALLIGRGDVLLYQGHLLHVDSTQIEPDHTNPRVKVLARKKIGAGGFTERHLLDLDATADVAVVLGGAE